MVSYSELCVKEPCEEVVFQVTPCLRRLNPKVGDGNESAIYSTLWNSVGETTMQVTLESVRARRLQTYGRDGEEMSIYSTL